jgi:hypothetical protein
MRASTGFPLGSFWRPTAMSFDKVAIGSFKKDFN